MAEEHTEDYKDTLVTEIIIDAKPTLEATMAALQQGETEPVPPAEVYYGLSDLRPNEVAQLEALWRVLAPVYRRRVLLALVETSETNFEMNYRAVGMMALGDDDGSVRTAAIELLWEDVSAALLHSLIPMAVNDPDFRVRAAAASAIGRFILAAELGDFSDSQIVVARQTMIDLLRNEHEEIDVKRRALEAISNSSVNELPTLIQAAYDSSEQRMRASALFAMGKSCDERWEDIILEEIDSDEDEMRFEAVRAAGELTLESAVSKIGHFVADEDREVQEAAIWSLGEIGGKEAMRILEAALEFAEDKDDEELIDAIEEAIGNASLLTGGLFGGWTDD